MASLYYLPQYRSTTLSSVGGIDASQTTGITITAIPADLDITLPGIICVGYADPLVTTTAEYISYTSIDGTNTLVGATRGAEGYSGKTHSAGETVAWVVSKSHINNINDKLRGVDATLALDSSGNEVIKTASVASAVNEVTVTNAATGGPPILSSTGGDTNVDFAIQPKGTGALVVKGTSTASAEIRLSEDTDNGTNYVGLKAPASTANITFTLPSADGTAGQALVTNASGTLSFASGGILSTTQYAPQGFLINGKIVPSVASNNLTVAIKGMDGNDPSVSNPVYCRIGDTVRTITAALSVTKNAGTNWFSSGTTGLATQEIDYFVYLGYNATDGVVVGFARIPYAGRYDTFSATSTNEKYCAISTITNAAASDYYEVVGRFAATLSAGAGYTWTVPTFTATNLIQRPIDYTRQLLYVPTHTGFSSAPTNTCRYKLTDTTIMLTVPEATQGTSNATTKTMTLPFSVEGSQDLSMVMSLVLDNTAWQTTPGHIRLEAASPTVVKIGKTVHMANWTSSGTAGYAFQLNYPIA